MAPALEVLRAVGEFEFEEWLFGGASIDAFGVALTDEALAACRASDAVLLAAVGGPRWDSDRSRARRGRSRACSDCARASACTRTCGRSGPLPALYDASPLRRERIEGTDLLVVRELTGGIYFGAKTPHARRAASDALRVHAPRRSSGSRARPSGPRARRSQRRQGQRARDPPPVAGGRRRGALARSSRTSSSSTCSSTTPPCSSSPRRGTST